MKIFILSCFTLLLATSCVHTSTETTTTVTTSETGNPKFIIRYPSDTTNFKDMQGRKQGMWIDFNSADPKPILYKDDTAYAYTDSTIQDVIKTLNSK